MSTDYLFKTIGQLQDLSSSIISPDLFSSNYNYEVELNGKSYKFQGDELKAAIKAVTFDAGSINGTVISDNTLSGSKIQNATISQSKLDTALQTKLNNIPTDVPDTDDVTIKVNQAGDLEVVKKIHITSVYFSPQTVTTLAWNQQSIPYRNGDIIIPCMNNGVVLTYSKMYIVTNENATVFSQHSYYTVPSFNVGMFSISNGEVTLNTNSITTTHLQDNSVTATKLASTSVTEAKLATSSVTSTKLADSSVTTAKLANNAVTLDKLHPDVRGGNLRILKESQFNAVLTNFYNASYGSLNFSLAAVLANPSYTPVVPFTKVSPGDIIVVYDDSVDFVTDFNTPSLIDAVGIYLVINPDNATTSRVLNGVIQAITFNLNYQPIEDIVTSRTVSQISSVANPGGEDAALRITWDLDTDTDNANDWYCIHIWNASGTYEPDFFWYRDNTGTAGSRSYTIRNLKYTNVAYVIYRIKTYDNKEIRSASSAVNNNTVIIAEPETAETLAVLSFSATSSSVKPRIVTVSWTCADPDVWIMFQTEASAGSHTRKPYWVDEGNSIGEANTVDIPVDWFGSGKVIAWRFKYTATRTITSLVSDEETVTVADYDEETYTVPVPDDFELLETENLNELLCEVTAYPEDEWFIFQIWENGNQEKTNRIEWFKVPKTLTVPTTISHYFSNVYFSSSIKGISYRVRNNPFTKSLQYSAASSVETVSSLSSLPPVQGLTLSSPAPQQLSITWTGFKNTDWIVVDIKRAGTQTSETKWLRDGNIGIATTVTIDLNWGDGNANVTAWRVRDTEGSRLISPPQAAITEAGTLASVYVAKIVIDAGDLVGLEDPVIPVVSDFSMVVTSGEAFSVTTSWTAENTTDLFWIQLYDHTAVGANYNPVWRVYQPISIGVQTFKISELPFTSVSAVIYRNRKTSGGREYRSNPSDVVSVNAGSLSVTAVTGQTATLLSPQKLTLSWAGNDSSAWIMASVQKTGDSTTAKTEWLRDVASGSTATYTVSTDWYGSTATVSFWRVTTINGKQYYSSVVTATTDDVITELVVSGGGTTFTPPDAIANTSYSVSNIAGYATAARVTITPVEIDDWYTFIFYNEAGTSSVIKYWRANSVTADQTIDFSGIPFASGNVYVWRTVTGVDGVDVISAPTFKSYSGIIQEVATPAVSGLSVATAEETPQRISISWTPGTDVNDWIYIRIVGYDGTSEISSTVEMAYAKDTGALNVDTFWYGYFPRVTAWRVTQVQTAEGFKELSSVASPVITGIVEVFQDTNTGGTSNLGSVPSLTTTLMTATDDYYKFEIVCSNEEALLVGDYIYAQIWNVEKPEQNKFGWYTVTVNGTFPDITFITPWRYSASAVKLSRQNSLVEGSPVIESPLSSSLLNPSYATTVNGNACVQAAITADFSIPELQNSPYFVAMSGTPGTAYIVPTLDFYNADPTGEYNHAIQADTSLYNSKVWLYAKAKSLVQTTGESLGKFNLSSLGADNIRLTVPWGGTTQFTIYKVIVIDGIELYSSNVAEVSQADLDVYYDTVIQVSNPNLGAVESFAIYTDTNNPNTVICVFSHTWLYDNSGLAEWYLINFKSAATGESYQHWYKTQQFDTPGSDINISVKVPYPVISATIWRLKEYNGSLVYSTSAEAYANGSIGGTIILSPVRKPTEGFGFIATAGDQTVSITWDNRTNYNANTNSWIDVRITDSSVGNEKVERYKDENKIYNLTIPVTFYDSQAWITLWRVVYINDKPVKSEDITTITSGNVSKNQIPVFSVDYASGFPNRILEIEVSRDTPNTSDWYAVQAWKASDFATTQKFYYFQSDAEGQQAFSMETLFIGQASFAVWRLVRKGESLVWSEPIMGVSAPSEDVLDFVKPTFSQLRWYMGMIRGVVTAEVADYPSYTPVRAGDNITVYKYDGEIASYTNNVNAASAGDHVFIMTSRNPASKYSISSYKNDKNVSVSGDEYTVFRNSSIASPGIVSVDYGTLSEHRILVSSSAGSFELGTIASTAKGRSFYIKNPGASYLGDIKENEVYYFSTAVSSNVVEFGDSISYPIFDTANPIVDLTYYVYDYSGVVEAYVLFRTDQQTVTIANPSGDMTAFNAAYVLEYSFINKSTDTWELSPVFEATYSASQAGVASGFSKYDLSSANGILPEFSTLRFWFRPRVASAGNVFSCSDYTTITPTAFDLTVENAEGSVIIEEEQDIDNNPIGFQDVSYNIYPANEAIISFKNPLMDSFSGNNLFLDYDTGREFVVWLPKDITSHKVRTPVSDTKKFRYAITPTFNTGSYASSGYQLIDYTGYFYSPIPAIPDNFSLYVNGAALGGTGPNQVILSWGIAHPYIQLVNIRVAEPSGSPYTFSLEFTTSNTGAYTFTSAQVQSFVDYASSNGILPGTFRYYVSYVDKFNIAVHGVETLATL